MTREVKQREKCPNCVAIKGDTTRNNLAVYADGKYCMACGHREVFMANSQLISNGIVAELVNRKLDYDTCAKYKIQTVNKQDGIYTIFPIYKNGILVKQKLKDVSNKKNQIQLGDTGCTSLFGMQLFNPVPNIPIVITEGEEDCMAVYQLLGMPAISITRGAQGAHKELLDNFEWLSKWKEVLLCFDMDEPGRKAVKECISIFEPGRVRDVKLPVKDANEFLLSGRNAEELRKCFWNAEVIKPSTIVEWADIIEEICTQPKFGTPWPWDFMNKTTYGCRLGEVYILAGPEAAGKTEITYKIIAEWVRNEQSVGHFDLERKTAQSAQRLISSILRKRIYIPGADDWNTDEVREYAIKLGQYIKSYRPESGKLTLESVLINIRYMHKAYGTNFFVIDNLKKLAVDRGTGIAGYDYCGYIVGKLMQIAVELNVTLLVLNHLAKSPIGMTADISGGRGFDANREGMFWASGRMPEAEHIFGGGEVCQLPDYVMVIARNRLSRNDVEHRTIRVKFLKTRFESSMEGIEHKLLYYKDSGDLNEIYQGMSV